MNYFIIMIVATLLAFIISVSIGVYYNLRYKKIENKKYDGELFIKDEDDEGINYILRIYDVKTLPDKKELIIKVKGE